METLWPYKQTKTKFWFKDGKKKLLITIKRNGGKTEVKHEGDRIRKNLMMDVGFTINNEEITFK